MLAPAAPHITEELWPRRLYGDGTAWTSIHLQSWPELDVAATAEATREIPVQVNGKLRDKVIVASDASVEEIEAAVLARERIREILAGREPDRIVVAGGGKLDQHRHPLTSAVKTRRATPGDGEARRWLVGGFAGSSGKPTSARPSWPSSWN